MRPRRPAALLLAAGLALAGGAAAQAPADEGDVATRLASAQRALASGDAEEAAAQLDALARHAGVSPALLQLQAQAELAAGRAPEAVLALERARWLAPRDAEIVSALATARREAGLAPRPEPPWERMRALASADTWALLALGGLAAFAAAAVRLAFGRPLGRATSLGATLAGGVGVIAAAACALTLLRLPDAVVLRPDVALRVAPFARAEARGTLHPAETVEILERHGGFDRVRTRDGRSGWVPSDAVAPIVPG